VSTLPAPPAGLLPEPLATLEGLGLGAVTFPAGGGPLLASTTQARGWGFVPGLDVSELAVGPFLATLQGALRSSDAREIEVVLCPGGVPRRYRLTLRLAGDCRLVVLLPGLVAGPAQERFQTLVDQLPFEVWACDTQSRYVYLNPATQKLWGNHLGTTPDETPADPETKRMWWANNARALDGEIVREEVTFEHGGKTRHAYTVVAPVWAGSAIQGLVGVNIDISELKLAQAQLAAAQRRLVEQERLAAVGELAAVLAHEVRNPLGAIFNALSGLRRQPLAPDAASLLGIVDEEAARLNATVTALLDFVRPLQVNPERQALRPLVEASVSSALRATPHPSVQVAVELDGVPDESFIDAHMLRLALTNVLTNALQAMPHGGALAVRARPALAPWSAEIQITDTGSGISAEHLARVFDPFFTTRATGTGLGLAVARRIIEAHQGKLTVASSPGQGTQFSFWLPPVPGPGR
jgi:PAS domain S-box-containing protein